MSSAIATSYKIAQDTTTLQQSNADHIPLTDISAVETMDAVQRHNVVDKETAGQNIENKDIGNKQIRTTCPYCGVGCGVLATIDAESGTIIVQGDPDHPSNYGKLCSKGSALAQTLGNKRRFTEPFYQNKQITMHPAYRPNINSTATDDGKAAVHEKVSNSQDELSVIRMTDWNTITQDIAQRLTDTIANYGADSVMFYTSGQLLTEDYYVANKLMKGFIGSNNIDSNSRLCMSSAVAGHKRSFGADLVPGSYTDLEDCELLVLIGSNMAWCHPILFGRFLTAKKSNPEKKLIVIDPRRTDSCEFADLHLPIAPGTDTHLYNGLLNYLYEQGHEDKSFTQHCDGLETALSAAKPWTIETVAQATQVDASLIEAFYKLVASNPKTVSAFSMGVNQSSTGTDKVNAIVNTHLLTGRVGKAGANPFSLTGQPNAMGGREVGALANLLAAHMTLDDNDHRQVVADFWQTPQPISPHTGLQVSDVADAILEGRVKAIWIMATNPVVSVPEADKFRQALAKCDLVIVSECSVDSDTARCADIVLPAQGWGEKSGTVTNSERRISRQRQLLPAVGLAKPDWWIMSQVAKHMGFSGFDYEYVGDVFNEHIALTDYENSYTFNTGGGNKENDVTDLNTAPVAIPRYLNIAKTLAKSITQNPAQTAAEFANTDQSPQTQALNSPLPIPTKIQLTKQQYDVLPPMQWGESQINMTGADFKHHTLKFVAITPPTNTGGINGIHAYQSLNNTSISALNPTDDRLALRLITGRLRDQWHTMTRTGLAPVLNQQQSEPTITISRNDAKTLNLLDSHQKLNDNIYLKLDASIVAPDSDTTSSVIANVQVSDEMRDGDIFMPIHWSDAFANKSRVGTLVPTKIDPVSGQPELKNSTVYASTVPIHSVANIIIHPDLRDAFVSEMRKLASDSQYQENHLLNTQYSTSQPLKEGSPNQDTDTANVNNPNNEQLPNLLYSLSRQKNSVLLNVALPSAKLAQAWLDKAFWQALLSRVTQSYMGSRKLNADLINDDLSSSIMVQQQQQQLRLVVQRRANTEHRVNEDKASAENQQQMANQMLLTVYIGASQQVLPSTHWLDSCFADISSVPSVKWLLAGRPASGYVDPGPTVCACMGVGENIIINAIKKHSCTTAASVGKCTKAGTNCGSCVGQINELIEAYT